MAAGRGTVVDMLNIRVLNPKSPMPPLRSVHSDTPEQSCFFFNAPIGVITPDFVAYTPECLFSMASVLVSCTVLVAGNISGTK